MADTTGLREPETRINFRVRRHERAQWKERAAAENITLTELIRRALENYQTESNHQTREVKI